MTALKLQYPITPRCPSAIRLAVLGLALMPSFTMLAAQQSVAPQVTSAGTEPDVRPDDKRGPTFASFEIQQGAILLHFDHAGSGLRVKGSGRGTFQIAGADHIWFPADAHLVNDIVVVSTSLVQRPTTVRYNWRMPAEATLFNSAGLPAAPFDTDALGAH